MQSITIPVGPLGYYVRVSVQASGSIWMEDGSAEGLGSLVIIPGNQARVLREFLARVEDATAPDPYEQTQWGLTAAAKDADARCLGFADRAELCDCLDTIRCGGDEVAKKFTRNPDKQYESNAAYAARIEGERLNQLKG